MASLKESFMLPSAAHQFAFYCPELAAYKDKVAGTHLVLKDGALIQRIVTVLRLAVGESCILFDDTHHALIVLQEIGKKHLVCSMETILFNKPLQPAIKLYLPLLKKNALEEVVYAAAEIGVNEIHLIITEKSQKVWNEAAKERLLKLVQAGAEQAKNYAMPLIYSPQLLDAALVENAETTGTLIFLDPQGSSLVTLFTDTTPRRSAYSLLLGPEGDLTLKEKEMLKKYSISFYKLTPTTLRAQQAAIIALGILRSCLS